MRPRKRVLLLEGDYSPRAESPLWLIVHLWGYEPTVSVSPPPDGVLIIHSFPHEVVEARNVYGAAIVVALFEPGKQEALWSVLSPDRIATNMTELRGALANACARKRGPQRQVAA